MNMQIPPKKKSGGKYAPQLKVAIAREYLTSDLGYTRLSVKYNIPHTSVINFVKWYRQKYPDGLTEEPATCAKADNISNRETARSQHADHCSATAHRKCQ
jgi:transposase-like protein